MKGMYGKKKKGIARKQVRHSHKTAAALEDVIAIQRDIIMTLGDTLEFARQRALDALEVAKLARRGPHAYNPDRPSGRRVEIRR